VTKKLTLTILSMLTATMMCGQSLGDKEVITQVASWLNALDLRDFSWDSARPFREYYDITAVEVIDRQVKGKEAKVICQISAQSLRQYKAGSVTDDSFSRIVGPGGAQVDGIKVFKLIFSFEKYDKGWILSGLSKRLEEDPTAYPNITGNPRIKEETKENLPIAETADEKVLDAKAAIKAVADAKGAIYARDELAKLNSDLRTVINQLGDRSKQNVNRNAADSKLTEIITYAEKVKAFIPRRITEARNAAMAAINEAKAAYESANALSKQFSGIGKYQADLNAMKADLAGLEESIKKSMEIYKNNDFFGAWELAKVIKEKAAAISEQLTAAKRR
jgi:hypothetical protein